ncbi:MAG TPA: TetR/AcrR family transcriptional regulator [Hellea balneolensis]|uniref:TetR/AcrR family transcriptional regulator n=1 Tax=Hellea balneolensis TaxID=287478 RepID=A0A7C5R0N5_9PROT|nr:TetR/AcrR family transcriptional regulator [Hellea balneolensis]
MAQGEREASKNKVSADTLEYECCSLSETASKIADTFQAMVMQRGYNAVSYGDLAKALGIRKASIHYHFPSKAELGCIVIKRYREQFQNYWQSTNPGDPKSYIRAYESFIEPIKPVRTADGISCLFGVLGAEYQTLCPNIQTVVSSFFVEQAKWLEKVFEGGRNEGVFHFKGSAANFAKLFGSALQGAMLIKKSTGSPEHFDAVLTQLEDMLYGRS